MNDYIKLCRREITEYIKIIFKSKYNKKINDVFLDNFINIRYYHIALSEVDIKVSRISKKIILEELGIISDKLKEEYKDEIVVIDHMRDFYYYILVFDNVFLNRDLEKVAERIANQRLKMTNTYNTELKGELKDIFFRYKCEKLDFLAKFVFDDFRLRIKKTSIQNVYDVKLDYCFEFPEIYNKIVVKRAFNSGVIAENKLKVEYLMVTYEILKASISNDFKKNYIVEFESSLLKKNKKLWKLLGLLDNELLQEKINLKINYRDFEENKELIFVLIRKGYKFALKIDDDLEYNDISIDKLQMFNYLIMDKKFYYIINKENDNIIID